MSATVLHLSDLHRDSSSAITTETLLESLRLDRDRYLQDGAIPRPDIAVVSGDIVYGVSEDSADAEAKLKEQYDEAREFLVRLADLFFDGDRERVVIVPGNHDVSHPHVLRATEVTQLPADLEQRTMIARQLREENSAWRWVWSEFALRLIRDHDCYARRFEPYAEFYSSFYEGKRTFSLDSSAQFAIHDFPKLDIIVIALSSCCGNDLYNRAGRIHPDCVAGATRRIADGVSRGRVAIAAWHHNLNGGPNETDYIDADILQALMDGGVVVGMHGHQHRPQFIEHRFTADKSRGMAVISAGTVCGGPRTLPPGRRRAYNLVVVDREAQSGLLHVRDMKNDGFGSPVWGPAHIDEFAGSCLSFPLRLPPAPISGTDAAAEAAELIRAGRAAEALPHVMRHMDFDLARRVALQALIELGDRREIIRVFSPPRSAPEFIALCDALYAEGRKADLSVLIQSDFAKSSDVGVQQSVEMARNRLGAR